MKHALIFGLFCFLTSLSLAQSTELAVDKDVVKKRYEEYNKINVQEKVYVQTDRTLFKPGDNIWFNVFLTDAGNKPSIHSDKVFAELISPKGIVISKLTMKNEEGDVAGHFLFNKNLPGGQYKIRVYSYWMQNFSKDNYFEKTLTLQKVSVPDVLMKLDFEREAYGPGDKVVANFSARTKNDVVFSDKKIAYSVYVQGNKILENTFNTDKNGKACIIYQLPGKLKSNDNLLNVQLENEGLTESISRSAPIVLNNLDIQLLPEGGNLIAGFKSRVAIKVLDEFGKPADISGQIVNKNGEVISRFETFHQGMGAFEFVPQKEEKYDLIVLKPKGIDQKWPLPESAGDKIGIYVNTDNPEKILIDLFSPSPQQIQLIAQQKSKLFFNQKIEAHKGVNKLEINTKNLPAGVVQLTVFDQNRLPHAERLVFAGKDRTLKATIKTNKEVYQPRDMVSFDITVTDNSDNPVQGNFSLSVVDDKQHIYADDKQDDIKSCLLMSSELKGEIYEPAFYFNPQETKAAKALDYVMLTQGWRRFDWKEVLKEKASPDFDFPQDNKEICGYLKIDGKLAKNQQVYLSKAKARYSKKKADATTITDENGFFKFDSVTSTPVYLSANFHGEYKSIYISDYSKTGVKKEKIFRYANWSESTFSLNYEDKKQNVALKGLVLDKNSNNVLPFANIMVIRKGNLYISTQSDKEGKFSFATLPSDIDDLQISYIGMKVLHIKNPEIKPDKTIYIEADLIAEPGVLDAVGSRSIIYNDTVSGKELTSVFEKKVPTETKIEDPEPEDSDLVVSDDKDYSYADKEIENFSDVEMNELVAANLRMENSEIKSSKKEYNKQNLSSILISEETEDLLVSNRYNISSGEFEDYGNENSLTYAWSVNNEKSGLFISQIEPQRVYYNPLRAFPLPDYSKNKNPQQRTDFRKTIYWNPDIKTNDKGKAAVSFYNSDEVSTFRTIMEGNSVNGQLLHAEHTYAASLPFSIRAKIPEVLSFGDTVNIPVVLSNNTDKDLRGSFSVKAPEQLELLGNIPGEIFIQADTHLVVYANYKVLFQKGSGDFEISFEAQKLMDKIKKVIEVAPKGFPVFFSMSAQELTQKDSFILKDVYDGSLQAELTVYRSIMDELIDGVEQILASPSGCFEQVSSSNYPNILALQLMEQSGKIYPEIRTKALQYLKSGYNKLTAYEIAKGGFDWYGRPPAHEGLTAYGLVQFKDMKEVFEGVNDKMIKRTQDFLLLRKDGKGGFVQNVGKYGFSGNKPALFNAYITWALSETGAEDMKLELDSVTAEALRSEDLYRLSLACLSNFNYENMEEAEELLGSIQNMIKKTGLENVKAESTLTYSYGNALNVETLSFAALAMMRSDKRDEALLVKIVKHILSKRRGAVFGSTQSTIMALKLLSTYHKSVSKARSDGNIQVYINNKRVKEFAYKKENQVKISIKGLEQFLTVGKNVVEIKFEGTDYALPYSFNTQWTASTPESHKDCQLTIKTDFVREVKMGQNVRLNAEVQNTQNNNLPSTMALIGIPAGLSVQAWQLKEMQEKGLFAFYELKDNYLILYYREMEGGEKKTLSLDLKTEVPGTYTAPANTAYLYYADEYKHWEVGKKIKIMP